MVGKLIHPIRKRRIENFRGAGVFAAMATLALFLIAADPPQTPAQIEAEMQRADEMPIATAPVEYRTPRKAFQTYWDAFKRMDESHFQSMTGACRTRIFGTDQPFTAAQLASMVAGHQRLMERNYQLLRFTYTSEPQKPVIVITYSYETTVDGQNVLNREVERLTFTRTDQGWKVDQFEEDYAE